MHHGSPRSSCQELHLRHNHWQREVHQQSLLFAHTRDWILLLGRWRCRQSRLSTSQGDMRETMANRSWLYCWRGRGKRNDTVTVCQSIFVEKCLSFWIQKCYLKVITRMTRRITCVASRNFWCLCHRTMDLDKQNACWIHNGARRNDSDGLNCLLTKTLAKYLNAFNPVLSKDCRDTTHSNMITWPLTNEITSGDRNTSSFCFLLICTFLFTTSCSYIIYSFL